MIPPLGPTASRISTRNSPRYQSILTILFFRSKILLTLIRPLRTAYGGNPMKWINNFPSFAPNFLAARGAKRFRIFVIRAGIVALLVLACSPRVSAQCKIGNGYPGTVNCGGQLCFGAATIYPTTNGQKWSRNPFPCSCTYSGGCIVNGEIRQFLRNEYAWEFQSRPAFFRGCDGSVLLVLRTGKPERAHAG